MSPATAAARSPLVTAGRHTQPSPASPDTTDRHPSPDTIHRSHYEHPTSFTTHRYTFILSHRILFLHHTIHIEPDLYNVCTYSTYCAYCSRKKYIHLTYEYTTYAAHRTPRTTYLYTELRTYISHNVCTYTALYQRSAGERCVLVYAAHHCTEQ